MAGIFHANNKSGTTILLFSSQIKYRTILNKTGHFDQFREFQLENMFQSELKLVESSRPLITPNLDQEREEGKKN